MEKWILRNRNVNIKDFSSLRVSDKVLKILVNRDIKKFEDLSTYIYPNDTHLNDAFKMKDFNKALDILMSLKESFNKIRIVGDYDVDGIISVYILYKTFKDIGLNVDFVIPDRVKDGYGINMKIVEEAKRDGVDTIITCDNGIAAIEVVSYAKELGLRVIVTDHHDIQIKKIDEDNYECILPPADAVLNPKQEDCSYEFKKLCGAGVCFKLCSELYLRYGLSNKIDELYEFVAIATVCDVVDLEGENRFFVKKGMNNINNTSNIGLNAIINVNSLEKGNIFSYEIGYVIGPCLNALGRLESATKGLDILLSDDESHAYDLALEIKNLNDKRKNMTVEGLSECIKIIEENGYNEGNFIVVYNDNIHESIAGIIAGRIKERYYKPTIVLTNGDTCCKGSARSIEGINIFEFLSDNKDLFIAFGGHPMAAGLSLDRENIDVLRVNLNSSNKVDKESYINTIYVDMFCPIQSIDYDFVRDLSLLEPFGKSNSKPILGDKGVRVCALRRIGKNKNYISMKIISNDGKIYDFVFFGDAEDFDNSFREKYGDNALMSLYSGKIMMRSSYTMDILYEVKIETYNLSESIKYFLLKYRF